MMYRPMAFLLTLIGLVAVLPGADHLAGAAEPESSAFHTSDLAVIRFPSPRQFALVLHEPEPAPRLYKVGDLLLHSDDTVGLLEVERIRKDSLVLFQRGTGRQISLLADQAGRMGEGLVFLGAVSLTEIQYRFEVTNQVMREAPVVLSMAESRAVLIQQVASIRVGGQPVTSSGISPVDPSRPGDRATAGVGIALRRIGEDTYEIDKSALAPTVDKLSKKLSQGLRGITQALLNRDTMLPVQSSVGDGVLTDSGFTVTQPKVAETFGIEVGDTIVSLNGKPVSSPLNAWWTFQEVLIRGKTDTVRVGLVRAGRPIAKTYQFK